MHKIIKQKKTNKITDYFISLAKSKGGFTLTELMVTMTIISILAGITIASSSNVKSGRSLGLATDQIVSDIRHVQNLALAGGMAPHFSTTESRYLSKPPCAFGIEFIPPTKYKVVYFKQNEKLNPGDQACGPNFEDIINLNIEDFPTSETKIEDINAGKEYQISEYDLEDIETGLRFSIKNDQSGLMIFRLPNGKKFDWTTIDPTYASRNETEIEISHISSGLTRVIKIHKDGSIEY